MNINFQEYADALLERINQPDLFTARNGILVTDVQEDSAAGELTVTPGSLNPRGIVHGGCLSTLMDTVAGIAACAGGRSCVTLNSTMNYIRAVSDSKKVYCKASSVKTGRTITVMQCNLTDDSGALVASGTYTYYMMEPMMDSMKVTETAQESAAAK